MQLDSLASRMLFSVITYNCAIPSSLSPSYVCCMVGEIGEVGYKRYAYLLPFFFNSVSFFEVVHNILDECSYVS